MLDQQLLGNQEVIERIRGETSSCGDLGLSLDQHIPNIERWSKEAGQALDATGSWFEFNLEEFFTECGPEAQLAWTDSYAYDVACSAFAEATKVTIERAAASLQITSAAALIGAAGGVPGMVAGFMLGQVIEAITRQVVHKVFGAPTSADQIEDQARRDLTARNREVRNVVRERMTPLKEDLAKLVDTLHNCHSSEDQARQIEQLLADNRMQAPADGDLSLFRLMRREWVFENAKTDRSPRDDVNSESWARGRGPWLGFVGTFAYQIRGFLGRSGLPLDAATVLIQRFEDLSISVEPRTIEARERAALAEGSKPIVFTRDQWEQEPNGRDRLRSAINSVRGSGDLVYFADELHLTPHLRKDGRAIILQSLRGELHLRPTFGDATLDHSGLRTSSFVYRP